MNGSMDRYPFEATQAVPKPDWEVFIAAIVQACPTAHSVPNGYFGPHGPRLLQSCCNHGPPCCNPVAIMDHPVAILPLQRNSTPIPTTLPTLLQCQHCFSANTASVPTLLQCKHSSMAMLLCLHTALVPTLFDGDAALSPYCFAKCQHHISAGEYYLSGIQPVYHLSVNTTFL